MCNHKRVLTETLVDLERVSLKYRCCSPFGWTNIISLGRCLEKHFWPSGFYASGIFSSCLLFITS